MARSTWREISVRRVNVLDVPTPYGIANSQDQWTPTQSEVCHKLGSVKPLWRQTNLIRYTDDILEPPPKLTTTNKATSKT